jgi:hypothetical protein
VPTGPTVGETGVGDRVTVSVGTAVRVAVGRCRVAVALGVEVGVAVAVGGSVFVAAAVWVGVEVSVGPTVAVVVAVAVGGMVAVGIRVGEDVLVITCVGVLVGSIALVERERDVDSEATRSVTATVGDTAGIVPVAWTKCVGEPTARIVVAEPAGVIGFGNGLDAGTASTYGPAMVPSSRTNASNQAVPTVPARAIWTTPITRICVVLSGTVTPLIRCRYHALRGISELSTSSAATSMR